MDPILSRYSADVSSVRCGRPSQATIQDDGSRCCDNVEIHYSCTDVLLYTAAFSETVTLDTLPETACWSPRRVQEDLVVYTWLLRGRKCRMNVHRNCTHH